jgi:hypothetical protein
MASPHSSRLFKVPDPFPLTVAGLLAALGPQAINFGISVGGGETMLIPNLAAQGAVNLFWIMTVSTIVETVVVIECVKYSLVTGRSFFTGTRDLAPRGLFWPWTWAVLSILTFAWPFWLGGASAALLKATGGTQESTLFGINTYYLWCWGALLVVLAVFAFSKTVYGTISKIFQWLMWINIIGIVITVAVTATFDDFRAVLWGYFNFGLAQPDHPISWKYIAGLYNQPGGSLMWVSLWVLEAGWGMGRYTGKVTGVLRPPEHVNTDILRWDYNDPVEVKKMQGWVDIGKWSQIIWWSILGAMLMTYLYATAGYAYFYKAGIVKSGLEIPIQIASIVGGIFGPIAFAVFLVFVFATLYDAGFAIIDTFVGRTVADAVAVTPRMQNRRPYRFYYFVVVMAVIAAGFYFVTVKEPYALWLFVATSAVLLRSIAAIQILYMNSRQLPDPFKPGVITKAILWFTFVTGVIAWALGMYATAMNV